ncbi:MAG: HAD family hydrolase [Oculatellaceae cyanobacterium Prado106]|jgi:phosphoglycolate phosphatase-like HAD superfamily hydrolase|nr:HAD family hydrolase [Oculatellaceae cyanobacterium Prado106]
MPPTLLALDFDGVLCDGLIEYFQTSWRAYRQIWTFPTENPPDGLAEQFYRLRPVVETGWEMPVLLHAILSGLSEAEILQNWATIAPQHLQPTGRTASEISTLVDSIRDQWIATDLDQWLSLHRFYPGVPERLQQVFDNALEMAIITTKEERFAKQLLEQQGIKLADDQIFGKSCKRPKAQTLQMLIQDLTQRGISPDIWFIEDRLKTLQTIATQPELSEVQLFLADWGYNTAGDRQIAEQDARTHLLSLDTFSQDFSRWLSER